MCGGSPSAPIPPPRAPEAPQPAQAPVAPSQRGTAESDVARRRRATGEGRSTILTGPRGVQNDGATAAKTLLGE